MKDFTAKTRRALNANGISIIGMQSIPDANGSFANSQRAYKVNDNGTGRIWTHSQVIQASVSA
jgi:hypothetical protein